MLSGENVAGLADDLGVASARGVLPISDAMLSAAVESVESAWSSVAAVESMSLGDADKRALLVRMESVSRAMYGTSHTWLSELVATDGLAVMPERRNPSRLACLLRINSSVAGKRIKIAAKLAVRRAMTGEKLDPVYPTTAAAHCGGDIDAAHAVVIDKFFDDLPEGVDHDSRAQSEFLLSELAKQVSPEQLQVAADRLQVLLDPDGSLRDEPDPVARCFFRLGKQDADGLSKGSFVVDAEFRAYLEAVLAKLAKPGNCNPDEPVPVIDDEPEPGDEGPGDSTLFDGPDGGGGSGSGGSGSGGGNSGRDGFGAGPCGNNPGDDNPGDDNPGDDDSGDDDSGDDEPGDDGGPGCGPDSVGGGSGDDGPENGGSGAKPASRDTVTDTDAQRRAGRDTRTQGQRNHDALKAVLRQILASGTLGEHRGLPVTAVISMTAQDLESACGHAVTGTGSLVPIRDRYAWRRTPTTTSPCSTEATGAPCTSGEANA